jgi:hypothetical protein
MKNANLFWGVVLLLAGVLLLLDTLNVIQVSAWAVIGPMFIIAIGVWILWGAVRKSVNKGQLLDVAVENAKSARLVIRHAAGKIILRDGSDLNKFIQGQFEGGIKPKISRIGDEVEVELKMETGNMFDWSPGDTYNWSMEVNPGIPFTLDVETGAAESKMDLRKLLVKEVVYKSGASSNEIKFPENVDFTFARIEAGAASFRLIVPEGVGTRIRTQSGPSAINADTRRFSRSGKDFVTADWESAAHRLEIELSVGVGSVSIQ